MSNVPEEVKSNNHWTNGYFSRGLYTLSNLRLNAQSGFDFQFEFDSHWILKQKLKQLP